MRYLASVLAAVVVCGTLLAAPAMAVTIAGTSSGSFSNLSSCDSSGFDRDCRITSSSNGPGTRVEWGSTSLLFDFVNPSSLTAVDVTISEVTPADDVVLARLDWYNSATWADSDLTLFQVDWQLTISFTQPSGSGDSEAFSLTITNPINPPGDQVTGLTLGDLSNLTFSLVGVTLSDLRYSVIDGAGSGISTLTLGNGGVDWYNPENNWATLLITADFSATSGGSTAPVLVAAPGTLLLLGGSLVGLSVWRRRTDRG